jgi:hypothetical protein
MIRRVDQIVAVTDFHASLAAIAKIASELGVSAKHDNENGVTRATPELSQKLRQRVAE